MRLKLAAPQMAYSPPARPHQILALPSLLSRPSSFGDDRGVAPPVLRRALPGGQENLGGFS